MLFGFGKYIRRTVLFFALFFLLLGYVKKNYPALTQEVSNWITGESAAPVGRAVTSLVDRLTEGGNIRQAVEVFYENFKTEPTG